MAGPILNVGIGQGRALSASRPDVSRGLDRAGELGSRRSSDVGPNSATDTVDFGNALVNALQDAGEADRTSEEMAMRFAEGDPNIGVHDVMIAASKADVAVRFAVTLKNRAVEAYREIMRTQV